EHAPRGGGGGCAAGGGRPGGPGGTEGGAGPPADNNPAARPGPSLAHAVGSGETHVSPFETQRLWCPEWAGPVRRARRRSGDCGVGAAARAAVPAAAL